MLVVCGHLSGVRVLFPVGSCAHLADGARLGSNLACGGANGR